MKLASCQHLQLVRTTVQIIMFYLIFLGKGVGWVEVGEGVGMGWGVGRGSPYLQSGHSCLSQSRKWIRFSANSFCCSLYTYKRQYIRKSHPWIIQKRPGIFCCRLFLSFPDPSRLLSLSLSIYREGTTWTK
jgi:hypothetical protein